MAKREAPDRRNVVERLDEHERLLALIIDKINEDIAPSLDRLAKHVHTTVAKEVVRNSACIEVLNEWVERGAWGRLWDRMPWVKP